MVRCSYFDVGNSVQNNIPKYIDQVLDGHVIQMLIKIDELLGQTMVQIRANVTSVVSIQTSGNCLSADSPRTHACLQWFCQTYLGNKMILYCVKWFCLHISNRNLCVWFRPSKVYSLTTLMLHIREWRILQTFYPLNMTR